MEINQSRITWTFLLLLNMMIKRKENEEKKFIEKEQKKIDKRVWIYNIPRWTFIYQYWLFMSPFALNNFLFYLGPLERSRGRAPTRLQLNPEARYERFRLSIPPSIDSLSLSLYLDLHVGNAHTYSANGEMKKAKKAATVDRTVGRRERASERVLVQVYRYST